MNRVERHVVKSKALDDLALKSKNLYNKANYQIRQKFVNSSKLMEQRLLDRAR